VERRERELERLEAAVDAQRQRLVAVQGEYESRRDALAARGREIEVERSRLRDEQAQLVAASLVLEERGKPVTPDVPVEPDSAADSAQPEVQVHHADPRPAPAAPPVTPPEPKPEPKRAEADETWWAKQLGRPLEAA
jgi:hypothetical protein